MRSKENAESNLDVWVPLEGWPFQGGRLEFTQGLVVESTSVDFLDRVENELSCHELHSLRSHSDWLYYRWSSKESVRPAEVMNSFLLAVWLVAPTRLRTKHRFELHQVNGNRCRHHVVLDRFVHNEQYVDERIEKERVPEVSRNLEFLLSRIAKRGRCNDAIALTFNACVSKYWQVRVMCLASALECLLTWSKEPGVTRRLGKAFAVLMEQTAEGRNRAFHRFCCLYRLRSRVVHGRLFQIHENDRLRKLGELEHLVSCLWRRTIERGWADRLEADDDDRKDFFEDLAGTWDPPRRSRALSSAR